MLGVQLPLSGPSNVRLFCKRRRPGLGAIVGRGRAGGTIGVKCFPSRIMPAFLTVSRACREHGRVRAMQLATSHTEPACPICLSEPQAAKMTRCGHMFCWTCMLRYIALGDRKWRRCPICYESVYPEDLRSVSIRQVPHYTEGSLIRLCLVERHWVRCLASCAQVDGGGSTAPDHVAQKPKLSLLACRSTASPPTYRLPTAPPRRQRARAKT